MTTIPHILFDPDTEIIYSTLPDQNNIRESFLKSLRRGDRIYFTEFCASAFDPDDPKFCLFQISGLPDFEYVFIEKDVFNSHEVNIAYFASDPSELYHLMSPSSHYYRKITGRCIYEILRTSSERELHLTPNGYLTIDSIPHLRDELISDPKTIEYCSLCRIAERIIQSCRDIPAFSDIELICPDSEDEDSLILAIPLCSYVFLVTAILGILHTLSEDHLIRIELRPYENKAETGFRVHIAASRDKDIDSSSLMSLGELSPSADSLAKIAATVAFNSKITTSVTCRDGNLVTDIGISRENAEEAKFHYRDPYAAIPSLVDEFIRFFGMFSDPVVLSGDETQSEDQDLGAKSV